VELVLGWAWVCERERERESEQREKEKGTMMRLMRRGEEPEARGPQWASGSVERSRQALETRYLGHGPMIKFAVGGADSTGCRACSRT
jgi:hypothetical protein